MEPITKKIKNWYRGKYVPPPQNEPGSGLIFMSPGHYEPSPSAKIVKTLVQFWLNHWKVLLPVIVAAAVALFIHFDSSTNATRKSEQKENHQVTGADHVSP